MKAKEERLMWSVRPATVAFVAGAQCGVLLLVALPVALHALVGHESGRCALWDALALHPQDEQGDDDRGG